MRVIALLGILVVIVLLSVPPALAGDDPHNPQFRNVSVSIRFNPGSLMVDFTEIGLGNLNDDTELVTLTVDTATAVYQCYNNGGNDPVAENKEEVSISLLVEETFPVGSNGQITGTIYAEPPGPGTFACPPGQFLYFDTVEYSGMRLNGSAGNFVDLTPDPIDAWLHILV